METVNGKHYPSNTKTQTEEDKNVFALFQGNVPLITTEPDPLQYILLGIVAGLVIVLLVLVTTLVCTRKK